MGTYCLWVYASLPELTAMPPAWHANTCTALWADHLATLEVSTRSSKQVEFCAGVPLVKIEVHVGHFSDAPVTWDQTRPCFTQETVGCETPIISPISRCVSVPSHASR